MADTKDGKMHTNDSQAVFINCDSPSRLSSSIDKAEEILLACLDLPNRVLTSGEIRLHVAAIEEVVRCAQWSLVDDLLILLNSSNVEAGYVSLGIFATKHVWTYMSAIMTAPISTS